MAAKPKVRVATTGVAQDGEIRVGISQCLLGDEVRFDGGHKRNRFVTDTLAPFVTFVPVCPEVEVGMATPREPIRLVRKGDRIRLVGTRSETDHTTAMTRYSKRRASELTKLDLDGYIFKKDSPSCGVFRVKVYGGKGGASKDGRGLFADAVTRALPELPVEEEGRLSDAGLRENFYDRLFGYRRLKAVFAPRWRRRDIIEFHSAEKLLLLAHRTESYKALGKLVARVADTPRAEFVRRYREGFMEALAVKATRGRHVNVLQHMAGYFRNGLDDNSRAELTTVIQDYRKGLTPLIVPVTLIKHLARQFEVDYLLMQTYLNPSPKELMLRNHV